MSKEGAKKSFGQFFSEAASKVAQKSINNIKELRSDIVISDEGVGIVPSSNQHNEQVSLSQFKQQSVHDQTERNVQNSSNRNRIEKSYVDSSSRVEKEAKEGVTESRVRQIQQEKMRINEQLRKLDEEIAFLKGSSHHDGSIAQNDYQKRNKISKNQQAQAKAQKLVKQLNKQRKVLQDKRRKQQEKLMQKFQAEQQEKRKLRDIQIQRAKQQRRIAIEKRLQEQKKRREQRKIIDVQSNNLIAQLKKQQKFEKQKSIVPSQLFQVQHKKRLLQNKKKLDFSQIQDHQKRYRLQKLKEREQRKMRQQSSKNVEKQLQYHQKMYPKNRWMELIEEEDKRRKQQQRNKQQLKKLQVEKRNKYAQVVQKVFIPKKKISQAANHSFQDNQGQFNKKPQTPDELPKVANKTKSQKRRTYDQKIFQKEESLPTIKDNFHIRRKKVELPATQEIDVQDKQKEAMRMMKMRQLRAQTNQRLKKLQNKSIEGLKRNQTRHKYENYLGKVNIKKRQDNQQWKKVLDNKQLSSQQKYRQLMNKASVMQNKAKAKQGLKRQTDQDAINLYIGSIQAKLALLQKF